jgi:hypothetical protein
LVPAPEALVRAHDLKSGEFRAQVGGGAAEANQVQRLSRWDFPAKQAVDPTHFLEPEESTMADFGRPKLSDAIPKPPGTGKKKRGKPTPTPKVATGQAREAEESARAHAAEASNRDRMVDIGRGNQQAGRQGS